MRQSLRHVPQTDMFLEHWTGSSVLFEISGFLVQVRVWMFDNLPSAQRGAIVTLIYDDPMKSQVSLPRSRVKCFVVESKVGIVCSSNGCSWSHYFL